MTIHEIWIDGKATIVNEDKYYELMGELIESAPIGDPRRKCVCKTVDVDAPPVTTKDEPE